MSSPPPVLESAVTNRKRPISDSPSADRSSDAMRSRRNRRINSTKVLQTTALLSETRDTELEKQNLELIKNARLGKAENDILRNQVSDLSRTAHNLRRELSRTRSERDALIAERESAQIAQLSTSNPAHRLQPLPLPADRRSNRS